MPNWRPEGWKNPYTCPTVHNLQTRDGYMGTYSELTNEHPAFEEGGDAMLEALRKYGRHEDAGWVDHSFAGLMFQIAGVWVFIPDEEVKP